MAAALIVFTGCGSSSSSSSSSSKSGTTQATTAPARAGPTLIREPFSKPANPGPHPGAKVKSLVINDVVRGSGEEIHSGDSGIFDFIASNWVTGASIESSWKRPRPFETRIEHGVVIDGWWQGIPGMRVGGRRRLILPPQLGFTQGMNPEVESATLYYDVVLLGVRPLEPPGMAAGGGTAPPPPDTVATPTPG